MRGLLIIVLFFVYGQLVAQQVPQYSQWFWNLQAHNPAFSGLKTCVEIKSLYRNQWGNLPGSPNSGFLTFSLPIYTERKKLLTPRQGFGFKFEPDKVGPFSVNRFNVNYAAHINFSPETRLSIGISAGVKQWVFDHGKTTTLTVDPIVDEQASFIRPDAGIGAWWNGKNYFISLAFSELLKNKWNPLTSDSRFGWHTQFSGGFRMVGTEKISILPFYMLRFPPKGPISMDLTLVFSYLNKIDVGIGLRNKDAIIGYFQYKFSDKFSLTYSVDFVTSELYSIRHLSHEFGISFGNCKSPNTNKTVCPLF
jgi:type IX secretion system PorP/SprF family membrane protein